MAVLKGEHLTRVGPVWGFPAILVREPLVDVGRQTEVGSVGKSSGRKGQVCWWKGCPEALSVRRGTAGFGQ